MESIYRLIKLNKLTKSHRVKFAGVWVSDLLHLRHLFVRLDPILACNLKCSMCYFSDPEFRKKNKGIFQEDEIQRIAQLFFPRTLQLVIGCGAEPTLHDHFIDLIKMGKDHHIPHIGLVTNGQLLTEQHIEQLVSHQLDELTISIHGVEKKTYERFMVNASYAKLHETLQHLDNIKNKYESSHPQLRLNYTVNPDNLEELGYFFETYGKYHIKTLQVRPMVDLGETEYTLKDLRPRLGQYNEILIGLAEACRKRNIIFMATPMDKMNVGSDRHSVILEAVFRHISPAIVWKSDFKWKTESYRDYCKRIKWRHFLFKCIFSNIHSLEKRTKSVTYDVNL